MRFLRHIATLLLLTSTVFAVEIAELRNGFNIPHRSRETRDGEVRLYLDDQKKSFVDVSAGEVERYRSEPDSLPATLPEVAKSTGQIVSEASEKHGVDSDFIHSVIKQESAGNAKAVSRTGARGLMQLMPGTAKDVARKLGVRYSQSRLLEPAYNLQLGTTFVQDQIDRFDGSYILALAGYNAGSKRVQDWIAEFGDPRSPNVDPIDWIELIPIQETRNYVQRIIENLQIYRAKLAGGKAPLLIINDLKR